MRNLIATFSLFFFFIPVVFAAAPQEASTPINPATQTEVTPVNPTTKGPTISLINPLGSGVTLEWLINQVLAFVVRIGSIIVILMLVYVGFKFVIARGNPEELKKARQALLWTIVGALILLGAQVIALGIQATVQALSVGK